MDRSTDTPTAERDTLRLAKELQERGWFAWRPADGATPLIGYLVPGDEFRDMAFLLNALGYDAEIIASGIVTYIAARMETFTNSDDPGDAMHTHAPYVLGRLDNTGALRLQPAVRYLGEETALSYGQVNQLVTIFRVIDGVEVPVIY